MSRLGSERDIFLATRPWIRPVVDQLMARVDHPTGGCGHWNTGYDNRGQYLGNAKSKFIDKAIGCALANPGNQFVLWLCLQGSIGEPGSAEHAAGVDLVQYLDWNDQKAVRDTMGFLDIWHEDLIFEAMSAYLQAGQPKLDFDQVIVDLLMVDLEKQVVDVLIAMSQQFWDTTTKTAHGRSLENSIRYTITPLALRAIKTDTEEMQRVATWAFDKQDEHNAINGVSRDY